MSRVRSGELLVALILILLGLLFLAGNLGLFNVDWSLFWPLMLILFGAWLIWRAFVPPPRYATGGAFYGFGDYRPDLSGKEIRRLNLSHGFGDFDLDLTRGVIADGENSVRASLGFGDLKVSVPRDVAVRVHVSAGFGDVSAFGEKSSGIAPSLRFQSDDYATATRKLNIDASIGFGDVKVVRAG